MNILELIVNETSGDAILQNAEKIWSTNRLSSFDKYRETATYVLCCWEEYGLQTEKIELPADGKTTYGDAVMPLAWNCQSASLDILSPTQKNLFTYEEMPLSVGMWSPPTTPEGVEGELVCLERGDPGELEQKQVSGKFVLTPGPAQDLRSAAAQSGAIAIISDYLPNPNGTIETQWIGSNSNVPDGWGTTHDEEQVILLSLSPDAGRDLRHMAEESAIRLRLSLQSEINAGTIDIASAYIPGQLEEDVLLIAPLYAPGANYNGASAASILEVARILQSKIDAGVFNKPQRGIRFLLVPKLYGSLALRTLKKEWLDRALYALTLEAGAGNPDIAWCRWAFRITPSFLRHYTDGLGWQIFNQYLQEYRPQRFLESRSFSLASETLFTDPAIGVPTHWLYGGTEQECRNNSLDTPDTLDKRSCIDMAASCTLLMLSIANVSKLDIPDLAYWNYQLGQERLNDDIQVFLNRVKECETIEAMNELLGEAAVKLPKRVEIEHDALQSLTSLDENATALPEWSSVKELQAMLKDLGDSAMTLIRNHCFQRCEQLGLRALSLEVPPPPQGDERVPKRTEKAIGAITLDTLPAEQWTSPVKTSPRRNLPFTMAWWLADGQRTVSEIERLLSMELYSYRECIPTWFTFLETHGYVEFVGEEKETEEVAYGQEEVSTQHQPSEHESM